MRNYEKALELLERDCKARPDSHIPLLHLANFYEEAGDFQRAIDYMKKLLRRNLISTSCGNISKIIMPTQETTVAQKNAEIKH